MTNPQHDPVDQARTHQPRAGVALKDTRAWPGYLLIAVAVIALVVCLTAAATGAQAVTVGAGFIAVLTALAGSVLIFGERRRVARLAQRSPADSSRQGNAGI
jgi:uncharacterized membrane protein YcjF (UPF0283 family)